MAARQFTGFVPLLVCARLSARTGLRALVARPAL